MKKRVMIGNGKVDKNTLLPLHFDGDLKDATKLNDGITGLNISYNTNAKFAKSVVFGNTNSRVVVPFNENLLLTKGKDMTVDFWLKRGRSDDFVISLYGNQDASSNPRGIQFAISNNNLAFYSDYDVNGSWISANIPLNTWVHIALVYMNNVFYVYKNGIRIGTINKAPSTYQGNFLIGQARDFSYSLNGAIDEYRISNIARWTSDFTPPTKPY